MADHQVAAWGAFRAHDALSAEAFGSLEGVFYDGDTDVEDGVGWVTLSSAHAAGDPRAGAGGRVGEPVVALL